MFRWRPGWFFQYSVVLAWQNLKLSTRWACYIDYINCINWYWKNFELRAGSSPGQGTLSCIKWREWTEHSLVSLPFSACPCGCWVVNGNKPLLFSCSVQYLITATEEKLVQYGGGGVWWTVPTECALPSWQCKLGTVWRAGYGCPKGLWLARKANHPDSKEWLNGGAEENNGTFMYLFFKKKQMESWKKYVLQIFIGQWAPQRSWSPYTGIKLTDSIIQPLKT